MRITVIVRRARNVVLGIRREDKNVWERRVPLTPSQVRHLLNTRACDKVIVQPASIRCFDDAAYEEAGAEIAEDLSPASTIVAVKEVPMEKLLPERTYMFFSHTIKAQPYNMPLLDEILAKKIRLFDYERIVNDSGRMVKFGPYAGYAGMVDTLHGLGLALLMQGYATPFLHIPLSKEYPSLEKAKERIREVGEVISQRGIPKQIGPLVIAITGSGSVSHAAQQILHLLPCKYVDVDELPNLHKGTVDNHCVYVVIVRAKDMVVRKSGSAAFSRSKYYKEPHQFVPVYHEKVAPYVQVLVNCMYWEPRFPRLLSTDQANDLMAAKRFPLLCLGDITCDPGGSVEFFVRSTTIQNPMYAYNIRERKVIPFHRYAGDGVLIMGVDHLPAEFPIESSTDFGRCLVPLLPRLLSSSPGDPLERQEAELGSSLFGAMVTLNGALTPNYKYIMELRKKHEESTTANNRAVVLGAGMVSSACVRGLLKGGFSVTVVDGKDEALERLRNEIQTTQLTTVNATLSGPVVEGLVAQSSVTVSLLPPPLHSEVAALTLKHNVPLVTTSYVNESMGRLRNRASKGLILNEIGLDPGIDILTSAELLHRIRLQGGEVESYVSLCGALPDPALRSQPMGYKFSWSPRGVLVAATRPSKFFAGRYYSIDGQHLYHYVQRIAPVQGVPPNLFWVPNGDVGPYVQRYELEGRRLINAIRGTIRYDGFASAIMAFLALGWLNPTATPSDLVRAELGPSPTWGQLVESTLSSQGLSPTDLTTLLEKVLSPTHTAVIDSPAYHALGRIWPTTNPPTLAEHIASAVGTFQSLGFMGAAPIANPKGPIFESLCVHLESMLAYKAGEKDFILMIHRIVARYAGNVRKEHTATLQLLGTEDGSATARTVGTPAAIAAKLLHEKKEQWNGFLNPEERRIYEFVLPALKEQGMSMTETTIDLPASSL